MVRLKNLRYSFSNVVIRRDELGLAIAFMDEVSELPPRENMDLKRMSRTVTFALYPERFIVQDTQLRNPKGKDSVTYNCRYGIEGMKITEGGL